MTSINNNTAATDVAARLWYSNNASGTFYMQLYYTQSGNWKGQSLSVYVNGAASGLAAHQPKRALGYGTSKGSDIVGSKRYELANHLGNVLSVITDRKWAVDDGQFNTTTGIKTSSTFDGLADYYVATIVSYSDYDPFGTMQDGRKGSQNGEKYRFGYQGSEKDDEIKGEGNSYTTHFRLLDPRLGRWFSTDPVFQPWQSPYSSMDNNPVRLNDPLGNWTDKKAQKVANKARKLGGEAEVFNDTGKKRDYSVHITKKYGEYTFGGSIGGRGRINSEEKLNSLDWLRCTKSLDYTLGNHKRNVAAYEAEKQREYNNEHSIMGRFTGGSLNGWVDKYAFHTQWNNNAFADQWRRNRSNVSAVNSLVKNMFYTGVALGTGGVLFVEYGGALIYSGTLGSEFELIQMGWNAHKAKFITSGIGTSVNIAGQLWANGGNFDEIDQVSVGAAALSPFLPMNAYGQGLSESWADANFDYSSKEGFSSTFASGMKNKSAATVYNDFLWNSIGNMGAASFGDVPFVFELTGEAVTNIPTNLINSTTNDQIPK